MLLAFDIGNTETTVGLFDGDTLYERWRLTTQTPSTPDELRFTLRQLIQSVDTPTVKAPLESGATTHLSATVPSSYPALSLVESVVICSVVPPVTQRFADACASCFGVTPIIIDALSPLPITLDVDEPATVGADRIVNTLAASQIYKRDVIVVDLGTATTYDCITADGTFLGGVIQPGVRISSETLFRRTSQLPATPLSLPERAIGRNTVDCIRAGVMFGSADSIDGIIRRIKGEWPSQTTPYVVATGGLAATFHALCREFDEVDPALTLKGLRLAYSIISG
jgi:type III pantothenate kinase